VVNVSKIDAFSKKPQASKFSKKDFAKNEKTDKNSCPK
jgi:hypothetical protein